MQISREWATPLTIGAFVIMASTGVLMFFHWDTALNKTAHEWLGWGMVLGVFLHTAVNWKSFKRYFSQTPARWILGISLALLLGSFLPLVSDKAEGVGNQSPPALAIHAISNAPISQVAVITGKSVEQLKGDLQTIGITVQADQSLASVIGSNRDLTGKALRVMLGSKSQPQ